MLAVLILISGCATPERKPEASVEATRARAGEVFRQLEKPAATQSQAAGALATVAIGDDPNVKILQRDPSGCTWVESRVSIAYGENDTKHQATAQAVAEARAKAMQQLLGITLQHQFMDFQQENLKGEASLTESLLRATQHGRTLKEKILSARPEDVGDCAGCRFTARIQTCIAPLPENSDKGFKANLSLNHAQFREGEEGFIRVTATRDAYLYLYNVDMNWDATLMYPNAYAKDNMLKADDTFVFPAEELRRRGIKIIAQLPPKTDISAETIRVIASKTPLPASLINPESGSETPVKTRGVTEVHGTGTFLDLMRRLNAADIEWVDDVQAFTITKK